MLGYLVKPSQNVPAARLVPARDALKTYVV